MNTKLAMIPVTAVMLLGGGCGSEDPALESVVDAGNTGVGDENDGSSSAEAGASSNDDRGAGGDSSVSPSGDSGSTTGEEDASVTPSRTFPSDRAAFGLGGASRCARADVLLCEDFEGDSLDTGTWTLHTWSKDVEPGTATIDSTRAARGKHSIHIQEPGQSSVVVLRETRTFAKTGNHFFGRFFMYLDSVPDALQCDNQGNCPNKVHWTAASAGGKLDDKHYPDVRAIGAVNQRLLVNLDGAPVHEVGIDDNGAPAGYTAVDSSHTKQWMCFEFEYAGEGETGELRVWWDGLEHPGLHYSTKNRGSTGALWAIPKYDHLDFGFTHYQDYQSYVSKFDAWIDEIIVDDERVGCAL